MVFGVEVVVTALLQALIKSLMSPLFENLFKKEIKLEKMRERLEFTLSKIRAVFIDAEEKQITNEEVEDWVNKVKDVVYTAEDFLDGITTEDLVRQESHLKKWFHTNKKNLKSKLQEIIDTLENLASQINSIRLNEGTTTTHKGRSPTSSHIEKSAVIGRQTEKEDIMKYLKADNEDNIKKYVVAIIGIGGVGKTTVAQLLYNETDFAVKAWIHMPVGVDVLGLTKAIHESVTRAVCDFTNLDVVQSNLKTWLENKKFLLVLDDMRIGTYEDWNQLCQPFASAAKGSRIIVTARSHHVVKYVCASYTHTLQPLSFEECFELFKNEVLDRGEDLNQELGTLAEELVRKCQGLPIAAKEFGRLIGSNREVDNWRKIRNSNIWTPPTNSTNILPVLRISYHYLLYDLKRCFAYCSIFPKGYVFDKEKVVLWWRAEGLLQQSVSEDRNFTELVAGSLFQQTTATKFTMHDLINELAQFVAGKFCFRCENQTQGLSEKTRHLSYIRDQNSGDAMKVEVLQKAKVLRTFLPLSLKESSQTFSLNRMISDKLLPKLTCLRVLSLSHYSITVLPDDIFKKMRHVRYLDLTRTNLKILPASVRSLYNLQTLLLAYCFKLTQLDKAICKLIRLEHLDLTETNLNNMPQNFGRLKRLQTLTTFVVGDGERENICELKDLNELRGKLTLVELGRVRDIKHAEKADLESKIHLKEIDFRWRKSDPTTNISSIIVNEEAVFDKLRPHTMIEELTIRKYYGNSFPAWISDPSFSKIVCLSLIECPECTSLPSLGWLRSLKELKISKMEKLSSIGSDFYTSNPESRDQNQQPFRSLELLSFEDMPSLKDWVDVKVYGGTLFPNLHILFMVTCPQLSSELPGCFPSLISLYSENVVFKLDADKYPQLRQLN